MVNRLLHPQEIEVYYILPTLRKYLALSMKTQGIQQKDIAKRLGIEGATVSQYLNDKRANKITFDDPVIQEVNKSAHLITDPVSLLTETQRLLHYIRQTKTLCTIHRMISNLPETCTPEAVGCGISGGVTWNKQ